MTRVLMAALVAGLLLLTMACASTSPPPTPVPESQALATSTPLFLEIIAPEDESVVASSPILVEGRTLPDAVVTVQGQPVELESDGSFATAVYLQEGPNAIEVIASNFDGNQEAKVLTVVYTP